MTHDRLFEPVGGQQGVTLIEIVICILIMGIAMVGIISGLTTGVRFSGENENRQRAEAALVSYGNAVKRMPYFPCGVPAEPAEPATYNDEYDVFAGSWDAPDGIDVRVTDVSYWRSSADPVNLEPIGWTTACPQDEGIQLLALEATYRDVTATAQIVKRDPGDA